MLGGVPFSLLDSVLGPGPSAAGRTFVLTLLWGHMGASGKLCGALS